jgi:hypothetical protein
MCAFITQIYLEYKLNWIQDSNSPRPIQWKSRFWFKVDEFFIPFAVCVFALHRGLFQGRPFANLERVAWKFWL